MKKLFFIILPILLLFSLVGWALIEEQQYNANLLPIEMIAYNSLTEEESSLILVSPKDSEVEKIGVTDEVKAMFHTNYSKSRVYKVTFNRTETETNGNLVVFVATDKKTVIGKGFDN